MARRTTKATEADSNITTEAPEEATVTATENEAATEQPTEEVVSEEPTTESDEKAEKPIDLSAFQATAQDAADQSDESTGFIPVELMAKVVEQYRVLDGIKAKNKAKAWLNAQMEGQVDEPGVHPEGACLPPPAARRHERRCQDADREGCPPTRPGRSSSAPSS